MTARSDEADRLWAALGDPMRIRLLDLLLERGEATASTLAGAVSITDRASPNTSPSSSATVSSRPTEAAAKFATPFARNASIRPAPRWHEPPHGGTRA